MKISVSRSPLFFTPLWKQEGADKGRAGGEGKREKEKGEGSFFFLAAIGLHAIKVDERYLSPPPLPLPPPLLSPLPRLEEGVELRRHLAAERLATVGLRAVRHAEVPAWKVKKKKRR